MRPKRPGASGKYEFSYPKTKIPICVLTAPDFFLDVETMEMPVMSPSEKQKNSPKSLSYLQLKISGKTLIAVLLIRDHQ